MNVLKKYRSTLITSALKTKYYNQVYAQNHHAAGKLHGPS